MENKEFDVILETRIDLMRSVLQKKAGEYASADDRLHNFKRAGAMLGVTSETALLGMLVKHLVSLFDIVDNWQRKQASVEMIDEKIGDTINYCVLLEALLKEKLIITTFVNNYTKPKPQQMTKDLQSELLVADNLCDSMPHEKVLSYIEAEYTANKIRLEVEYNKRMDATKNLISIILNQSNPELDPTKLGNESVR
jgi:hypothetical protein